MYSKLHFKIGNKKLFVHKGVLQGAISSPILFDIYIYINDLLIQIENILAYADNVVVIGNGKNKLKELILFID